MILSISGEEKGIPWNPKKPQGDFFTNIRKDYTKGLQLKDLEEIIILK